LIVVCYPRSCTHLSSDFLIVIFWGSNDTLYYSTATGNEVGCTYCKSLNRQVCLFIVELAIFASLCTLRRNIFFTVVVDGVLLRRKISHLFGLKTISKILSNLSLCKEVFTCISYDLRFVISKRKAYQSRTYTLSIKKLYGVLFSKTFYTIIFKTILAVV